MSGLIIKQVSETITENIFRSYYGADTFIEKSAIPKTYGFVSKKEKNMLDILIFSRIWVILSS